MNAAMLTWCTISRVIGLLGLAIEGPRIKVDYSLPIEEFIWSVTKNLWGAGAIKTQLEMLGTATLLRGTLGLSVDWDHKMLWEMTRVPAPRLAPKVESDEDSEDKEVAAVAEVDFAGRHQIADFCGGITLIGAAYM